MIFTQKIPCYVLIFEQMEIIKKTLSFLSQYANTLEIIIIENPSANSPQIKELVEQYGSKGIVKRHYLFDKNITGNAFSEAVKQEINYIKRHKHIIITDGDITSKDPGWLKEEKKVLRRNRDVFACGISLSMTNLPLKTFPDAKDWIPPDSVEEKDYFEVRTGAHLLLMRSKEFLSFMAWKDANKLSFVDGNLHTYCYDVLHKKWARTKYSKAYHLTWDLYHDKSHPYTKFKLAKSFDNTWYHQELSGFTLREFK